VTADVPLDSAIYARLRLAWTFLLTQPGLPLVYYGDELGMPGFKDPGNRAPFGWYTSASAGGVADVAAGLYHPDQHEDVLWHVAALGAARQEHPSLWRGTTTNWWSEQDLYAFARTTGDDHAIVVLNRGGGARTLSNGLAYAGLPTGGTWEDVQTGETFAASGDSLTVDVGALASRVLVAR
jgi:glycosidase